MEKRCGSFNGKNMQISLSFLAALLTYQKPALIDFHVFIHEFQDGEPQRSECRQRDERRQML